MQLFESETYFNVMTQEHFPVSDITHYMMFTGEVLTD